MTPTGSSTIVVESVPEGAGVRLAMLAGEDGEAFTAEQLIPLSAGLMEEFRACTSKALEQVHNSVHVPYAASRKPDPHEVVTTSLADVEPLTVALGALDGFTDLAAFDPDGEVARQVDLYVVRIDHAGRPLYFTRATSNRRRLKRTNKIAAVFTGTAFEALEDDPFLFDTRFDAVVDGEDVYVLDQRSFERSLGFLAAARAAAETTIRQAIANLAIANQEDFVEAVKSDLNMISKARSIAERLGDPDYAARMTADNLIAASDEHPQIDIDWETASDGTRQLVFHTDVQRRWRILKVLDDDYLQSLVTEFVYESNSKHHLT